MLLVYVAVVLFVAMVALIVGRQVSRSPSPTVSPSSPGVWQPSPRDGAECLLYRFPPRVAGTLLIPGAPSLQPAVLDGMSGASTTASCVDPDTLVAQKMQRVCTANPASGGKPACSTFDGKIVGEGYVEYYYASCVSEQCPGTVAAVTVNAAREQCLDVQGDDLVASVCNPLATSQQFVVTRRDSTTTAQLKNGGGQGGPLAQIKHRTSGLCVTTNDNQSGSTNGPAPCQANITGSRAVLAPCDTKYEWVMAPSTQYCRFPGRGPADLCCSSGPQCDNGTPRGNDVVLTPCCQNTPQQFVRSSTVPPNASSVEDLVGGDSLAYGGLGALVVAPFSLDASSCVGKAVTSNYVSLSAYNYQSEQALCQDSPSVCLPL